VPFSFVIVGVIGELRAPCIRCRVGESLVRVSLLFWRERMREEKFRPSVLNVPMQKTTVQMENLQNIKIYNPRSPNS
jgi:hypothetical protein